MNKKCGLVDGEYIPAPRIQDGLSAQLSALGFNTMAEDVLDESDHQRLCLYAKVIAKQVSKTPEGRQVIANLRLLRLL